MIQQSLDTDNVEFFSAQQIQEQVAKDIKGLQLHFRRTPKRRHVPSTCVPAEVYWCLLHPNYRICENHAGVWYKCTKVTAEVWYREIELLCMCIYHRQWMPTAWAHAEVILLPKDPSKPDPCGRSRLIFAFCPMSNALFCTVPSTRALAIWLCVRSSNYTQNEF